jgi:hypothetical protein
MTSEYFTGWRKASYSGGNGDCVQVGWRTSSHSDAHGNCVQVRAGERVIGVRDTKERGRGPLLEFPAAAWRSFIATAKSGAFR